MAKRNSLKINKHFGRDDFVTKAQVKLSNLRSHNSTSLQRRKPPNQPLTDAKARCFTTEL